MAVVPYPNMIDNSDNSYYKKYKELIEFEKNFIELFKQENKYIPNEYINDYHIKHAYRAFIPKRYKTFDEVELIKNTHGYVDSTDISNNLDMLYDLSIYKYNIKKYDKITKKIRKKTIFKYNDKDSKKNALKDINKIFVNLIELKKELDKLYKSFEENIWTNYDIVNKIKNKELDSLNLTKLYIVKGKFEQTEEGATVYNFKNSIMKNFNINLIKTTKGYVDKTYNLFNKSINNFNIYNKLKAETNNQSISYKIKKQRYYKINFKYQFYAGSIDFQWFVLTIKVLLGQIIQLKDRYINFIKNFSVSNQNNNPPKQANNYPRIESPHSVHRITNSSATGPNIVNPSSTSSAYPANAANAANAANPVNPVNLVNPANPANSRYQYQSSIQQYPNNNPSAVLLQLNSAPAPAAAGGVKKTISNKASKYYVKKTQKSKCKTNDVKTQKPKCKTSDVKTQKPKCKKH